MLGPPHNSSLTRVQPFFNGGLANDPGEVIATLKLGNNGPVTGYAEPTAPF